MKSIRKFFGDSTNTSHPTSPTEGCSSGAHKGAHRAKVPCGKKRGIVSPTSQHSHHFPHSSPAGSRNISPQPTHRPRHPAYHGSSPGSGIGRGPSTIPPALVCRPREHHTDLTHVNKHESDLFSPVTPQRSDTFHDPRERLGQSLMASAYFEKSGMVWANSGRVGGSGAFAGSNNGSFGPATSVSLSHEDSGGGAVGSRNKSVMPRRKSLSMSRGDSEDNNSSSAAGQGGLTASTHPSDSEEMIHEYFMRAD